MKYFLTFFTLIFFAGAVFTFYQFKPAPKRKKREPIIPAVQTTILQKADFDISLGSFGTVIPEKELTIVSEVPGKIIDKNDELVPGGFVAVGEMIAQIDPADFKLQLRDRQAAVVQAENALELESGNQTIALQEYELFKEELVTTDQGRSLVLREPQLRQAEARLDAVRSKLEEAELELGRTTIRSPFNALVLEHFIEEGKYIARHGPVARLVATDRFWISLSVPITALSHINIPEQPDSLGSPVSFVVQANNGSGLERTGHIVKLQGAISTENRMAQLIAAVEDPLDLYGDNHGQFRRLLLGSYVIAEIDCGRLDDVYRIPRTSLREQDAIWILDDSQLRIVEVDIVWSESDAVLIRGDFDGTELITSRIQNPLPGMKLRSKKRGGTVERVASPPGGGNG